MLQGARGVRLEKRAHGELRGEAFGEVFQRLHAEIKVVQAVARHIIGHGHDRPAANPAPINRRVPDRGRVLRVQRRGHQTARGAEVVRKGDLQGLEDLARALLELQGVQVSNGGARKRVAREGGVGLRQAIGHAAYQIAIEKVLKRFGHERRARPYVRENAAGLNNNVARIEAAGVGSPRGKASMAENGERALRLPDRVSLVRLDPALCHAMLKAREPRFDGLFFVGVRTTGIYCRSVCPARTPSAASCVFFASAAAAEDQGFRPCLRCRPELAPGRGEGGLNGSLEDGLPEALFQHLRERATSGASVGTLARECGFSLRHLRRLMRDHYGATPVSILQTERLLFAKKLLQETQMPIVQVAESAGFGSLRRLNALFQSRYGTRPSAWRRNGSQSGPASGVLSLKLSYRPPFAWAWTLDFFRKRVVPGVEAVDGDAYQRIVALDKNVGWIRVRADAAENTLRIDVTESLARRLHAVLSRVRALFDLDANSAAVDVSLGRDPFLKPMIERCPGVRVPGGWTPFEIGVRAILGQQISVAAAATLAGRLAQRFGAPVAFERCALRRAFPSARALAEATPADVAAVGLPLRRAETLTRFARWLCEGGWNFPPGVALDDAVRGLTSVKGIGEWTALYIALRALRSPDAFPSGDLGLRKALGGASAQELERRSRQWRPWRAYAVTRLWQSLEEAKRL